MVGNERDEEIGRLPAPEKAHKTPSQKAIERDVGQDHRPAGHRPTHRPLPFPVLPTIGGAHEGFVGARERLNHVVKDWLPPRREAAQNWAATLFIEPFLDPISVS